MNKLKVKDVVMVALLTALYLLFYMVSGMAVMVLGAFGHAVSPGVCAVFAGTVFFFMTRIFYNGRRISSLVHNLNGRCDTGGRYRVS